MRKGTKQHITSTCIKAYEEVLIDGRKDSLERFKERILKNKCSYGVCHLYSSLTEMGISEKSFIQKLIRCDSHGSNAGDFILYWWKMPIHASSKKEAIECIQYRMNILYKWLPLHVRICKYLRSKFM